MMVRRAFPLLGLLAPAALALAQPASPPPGPPRVSPMATVEQVVGISQISITYSRPAVRERTIWGELVPWGEVWRTGANEATTITFSDPVKIDGHDLAAGTYALFTIPTQGEWTLIFNKEADVWGAFNYRQSKDALRVRVKPREAPFVERFEISIPEVGSDSAVVSLRWEKVEIPFQAGFDVREITARRAREFVAAATPADGRMVWNWANYFYQSDYNLDEALAWASQLAQAAPMYWTHALEARLLARTGQLEEARAAADKALQQAEAESDQPGVEQDSAGLAQELASWKE